jgi:hypothetical protein
MTEPDDDHSLGNFDRFVTVDLLALMVCGAGVGFLMGLSVTPVVVAALTSFLGIIAGAATTLRALPGGRVRSRTARLPLAVPAACLMTGIALGAPAGVITRTHAWLESRPDSGGRGARAPSGSSMKGAEIGGLFGVRASTCDLLLSDARENQEQLRHDFQTSQDDVLVAIERKAKSTEDLREAAEWFCRNQR